MRTIEPYKSSSDLIGNLWIARYLVASLLVASGAAFAEVTNEVRMNLVDSISREPISGAQVTYSAKAREGTLSGHGGKTVTMFEVHAQSDASGSVTLPPTKFAVRGFGVFGLNTNYESPSVTIVKAGYARVELRNSNVVATPGIQDTLRWELNGATVSMKKATAMSDAQEAERAKFAEAIRRAHSQPILTARPDRPTIKEIRAAPPLGGESRHQ